MSIEDLKALATVHGTDKWNSHWYAQHYERHFAPRRLNNVRLLEIGVGGYEDPKSGGESLRMWKQFFPMGTIVGLDLFDKTSLAEDRIHIFKGSQTDTRLLGKIVNERGPFDLIVDDGSHRPEHVIATFEYLFQHGLSSDGIYAVEDLQTSYWRAFGGASRIDARGTSMAYFKTLCDRLNFREWHHPGYEPNYIDLHVVGVHYYHNIVFVDKGENNEESNLVRRNHVPYRLRTKVRGAVARKAFALVERSLKMVPYGEQIRRIVKNRRDRLRGID